MSVAGLALHPFAAPRDLPEALGAPRRARRAKREDRPPRRRHRLVRRAARRPAGDGRDAPARRRRLAPRRAARDLARRRHARRRRLRVGGAVTYLELRKDARVAARCPLLAAMARDVGALQIQARGTLAGNLASGSPAADGVCALAALDATLLLRSVRGARRVPLAGFYTGYRKSVLAPDELIEAIEIALPPAGSPFAWRKVGTRQAQAISKVALAGVAVVENGRCTRLGLGMASVAPTVAFLPATRALGLSRPLAEITAADLERAVLADVAPIDDIRSTAAYRRHVAVALVTRFFEGLASGTPRRDSSTMESTTMGSLTEGPGLRSTLCGRRGSIPRRRAQSAGMRPETIAASVAALTRSHSTTPWASGRTPTRRRTSRVRPVPIRKSVRTRALARHRDQDAPERLQATAGASAPPAAATKPAMKSGNFAFWSERDRSAARGRTA